MRKKNNSCLRSKKTPLHVILISILFLFTHQLYSQDNVGIGTNTPDPSAALEVLSADKGVLIPRIGLQSVTDVTTIPAPAVSLLVYNTNAAMTGGAGEGFYYWDGVEWVQALGPPGPAGPPGAAGPAGPAGPVGCSNADFVIKSDGSSAVCSQIFDDGTNVGIGMTTPTFKLHVAGRVKTDGITESSDIRLKKNINTINDAINIVSQLRGVTYDWKDSDDIEKENLIHLIENGVHSGKSEIGLIAQEVEAILPEVVNTDAQGLKSIEYSKLSALLIEAVKSLSGLCEEQNRIIQDQNADISTMKADIERITRYLELKTSNE